MPTGNRKSLSPEARERRRAKDREYQAKRRARIREGNEQLLSRTMYYDPSWRETVDKLAEILREPRDPVRATVIEL